MTDNDKKRLEADPDGLLTYEFIANHIGDADLDIEWLADNIIFVDPLGQFTGSAARYLNAINSELFAPQIEKLIASTIDKDREHRYLPALVQSIWGDDYESRAEQLSAASNNFRRIYKRLYPTSAI